MALVVSGLFEERNTLLVLVVLGGSMWFQMALVVSGWFKELNALLVLMVPGGSMVL